jgi:hypothetical protein
MSLMAGCPRCPTPVAPHGTGTFACPEHGVIRPLWRAGTATYDAFVEHLERADGLPTYLPWPLTDGWRVGDFAVVPGEGVVTIVTGSTPLDGDVEIAVVAEEVGVGLGQRIARTGPPSSGLWGEPPSARVRVDGQPVPVWPVSVLDGLDGLDAPDAPDGPDAPALQGAADWDRSVLAGESGGRWLWLVVRPAAAVLLLHEDWALRDVSQLGMALVEVPFGGSVTGW